MRLFAKVVGGFCVILMCLGLASAQFNKSDPYVNVPHSYASAVQRAAPSVVNIFTRRKSEVPGGDKQPPGSQRRSNLNNQDTGLHAQTRRPQRRPRRSSLGSGVIMDEEGYILTNNHVVRNAQKIAVALADGRRVAAKLIGTDPETDLAVLHVQMKGLRVIPMGNSDEIHVGDIVLAIGNPFGLGQTVTQGIVSAIGRNTIGINQLENYIQTDAAINPGNSGGALVNTRGQLIGINTGIYSRSGGYQGVGFAIPVNVAMNVLDQIVRYGYVKRGWVGANVRTMNMRVARVLKSDISTGVVVIGTVPKSPASLAGIKSRDIITTLDNTPIYTTRGFLNYIAQRKPGSSLTVTLYRKNKRQIIKLKIGTQPKPPKDARGVAPGTQAPRAPGGKIPPGYIPDDRR